MTDDTTLHRTIKKRTSSKLPLARQWAERINHEHLELRKPDAKDSDVAEYIRSDREYNTWISRVVEDVKIHISRMEADGYKYALMVNLSAEIADDGYDYAFVPYIVDIPVKWIQVWRKEARK